LSFSARDFFDFGRRGFGFLGGLRSGLFLSLGLLLLVLIFVFSLAVTSVVVSWLFCLFRSFRGGSSGDWGGSSDDWGGSRCSGWGGDRFGLGGDSVGDLPAILDSHDLARRTCA